MTSPGLIQRIDRLKADLVDQGRRVQSLVEMALTAAFETDTAIPQRLAPLEDAIDRVDVDIERAAVRILSDASGQNSVLDEHLVRRLLTIVKVNNELERIADQGTLMGERVSRLRADAPRVPSTFRVMGNSVVAIVRDATRAVGGFDANLAQLVLRSEDTVEAFKGAIMLEAEQQVLAKTIPVDFAFFLQSVASRCVTMADHCTNIAQQVIYATTGTIVRHTESGWVDVTQRT